MAWHLHQRWFVFCQICLEKSQAFVVSLGLQFDSVQAMATMIALAWGWISHLLS